MRDFLLGFLTVAAGSLIGGPLRFLISGLIARRFGETFPWGTLVVNVSGGFVMGVVGGLARAHHQLGSPSLIWLLVATGVLGSYTTVSSFTLQTLALLRDGERRNAAINVGLSLFLCLGAAAIGSALTIAIDL
jgi:CrcB protein